jgi:hypothetical protein
MSKFKSKNCVKMYRNYITSTLLVPLWKYGQSCLLTPMDGILIVFAWREERFRRNEPRLQSGHGG